MTRYTRSEIAVGLFVVAGAAALGYLSISIGGLRLWRQPEYSLDAHFAAIGDLKLNAPVKLAGVKVGEVHSVRLAKDYSADVNLHIERSLVLPADTIASIRTTGLLGESFVALSPGASEKNLANGDRISQTEPAIDLIQLLVKYGLKMGGSSHDNAGGGGSGSGHGAKGGGAAPNPFSLE